MTGARIPLHARNHLPGGSDPLPISSYGYPVNENAGILTPGDDIYSSHWAAQGTVDTGCLYNGYIAADGTVGAYITWRFMLGPFGSIHEFVFTYRTGPDYGDPEVFLASIPESDSGSAADNPAGVLTDISSLSWVKAFDVTGYSASLTPNVVFPRSWGSSNLRVMGATGATLTAGTFDPILGVYEIDGGSGAYAMKIAVTNKAVASTGHKFDLQDIHRKRIDWAFG